MIRSRLLPALLAALALTGCDSSNTGPLPDPEPARIEVLPLDIGRTWVMEFTTQHPSSGEVVRVEPDTFRVVGDTLIGGERWTRITATTHLGRDCFAGLFAYREDGLYRWPESAEEPYLYLPYPKRGEGAVALRDSARIVIPQATQVVEVPAGSLQAYDFTKRWTDSVNTTWGGVFALSAPGELARFFAADVGPVYLETGLPAFTGEEGNRTIVSNLSWRLVSTSPGA